MIDPNSLAYLYPRDQGSPIHGQGPNTQTGNFQQGIQALFGINSGSNFPGAPGAEGGLFPSIGSGPFGIRDMAPGLLGYDLERQQGAYDQAFAGQNAAFDSAQAMFQGLAGELSKVGESGLSEIRDMNQQNLDAFQENKAETLAGAKDRYLGSQASTVAGTSGRIASERARIQNDPSLSPAQKNAMIQELSFGIGQQGYGAASQAHSEYQALNTGLEASFAQQEAGLRGQNTGFVSQGYDRLGQLTAQGQQAGASGMMQLGQLRGAMPQQLVSLFGGLTNLEQFRQGTSGPVSYQINVPRAGTYNRWQAQTVDVGARSVR